jgi:hypothetical protein
MDDEIQERTRGAAGKLFNTIKKNNFWQKKEIRKEIKIEIVKEVATPILIYGLETWTLNTKTEK